jgi:beta-lactam-binding protein with PASTA domain
MIPAMPLKLIVLVGVFVTLATPVTAGAYTAGVSQGTIEAQERESKEDAERQARENTERKEHETKAAEEKKAEEERPQREAAERKQREETREEAERAEKEAKEAAASQCVVPSLKGDTLAAARRALRQAHCKLGRVTPPPRGHGRHVVTRQGLRAGSKHPAGTAVAVTLGPVRLGR